MTKTVILSTFSLFCVVSISFAQKGKVAEANTTSTTTSVTSSNNDAFSIQMSAYKTAMRYYDLQAATVAIYNAYAIKPERTDLVDTLAYLYFTAERYPQSYLVGEEILQKDDMRNDMREIVAVSKQSLGMSKEALADYETLFRATKELQYLYQIATLQYQLKRYGECIATLDQIIADPASAQQEVALRNQDGTGQKVPMKAAAHNIKGICAMEVSQNDAAKDNFKKALELYPDFLLAKNNVAYLEQLSQQKPATGQAQPKNPTATPQKPAVAPTKK